MARESGGKGGWSKKKKVLCCGAIALGILLLAGGIHLTRGYAHRKQLAELGLSATRVGFNFDPTMKVSRGGNAVGIEDIYIYDILSGDTQTFSVEGVRISDCDFQSETAIGRTDTSVVEVSLRDGTFQELGPAKYQNEDLLANSIRKRPNSRDFSAVTAQGELVLWQEKLGQFQKLVEIKCQERYFDYSWIHGGADICVRDEDGIAILNLASGEQTHWLTLPITDPPYKEQYWWANRKSFEVSDDGAVVVYCQDEALQAVWLNADREIKEEHTLGDSLMAHWGFAISSSGSEIVFVSEEIKRALFDPHYYETWIYREGEMIKLLEADYNGKALEVYW